MQRAGALDQQITIIREIEAVAASGAVSKEWGQLAVVRAELVKRQTKEDQWGFGEADSGPVVFRMRYRLGIQTADRVICGGATYDIDEIVEIGRNRIIELRTSLITSEEIPFTGVLPIISDDEEDLHNVLSSAQW